MRIAQVVTLASSDGAFGGPLTVAAMQTEELARRGHTVDLYCGWDGRARFAIPGVDVRLFRARHVMPGMSGLTAPGLVRSLATSANNYDVVHIHMGRDLVTAAAADAIRRQANKYVLQPHGMIMPDSRARARLVDKLTIRKSLTSARAVLALGSREEAGLEKLSLGKSHIVRLGNGVNRVTPAVDRDPDLVVFLARLHPRKRVQSFVAAAHELSLTHPRLRFEIWGPDEGEREAMLAAIKAGPGREVIAYMGATPPGDARLILARASVYVLPSRGEVFPMTVLEAMSVGTPVVMTEDSEISAHLAKMRAAVVVSGDAQSLAEGVRSIQDWPEERAATLAGAERMIETEFGIESVVNRLEDVYRQ